MLITNKKFTTATKRPDILIVDKESFAKYPKMMIMMGKVTPLAVTPTEKETMFIMIIKQIPAKMERVMLLIRGARLHFMDDKSQM
jgi:hypothetical protein